MFCRTKLWYNTRDTISSKKGWMQLHYSVFIYLLSIKRTTFAWNERQVRVPFGLNSCRNYVCNMHRHPPCKEYDKIAQKIIANERKEWVHFCWIPKCKICFDSVFKSVIQILPKIKNCWDFVIVTLQSSSSSSRKPHRNRITMKKCYTPWLTVIDSCSKPSKTTFILGICYMWPLCFLPTYATKEEENTNNDTRTNLRRP